MSAAEARERFPVGTRFVMHGEEHDVVAHKLGGTYLVLQRALGWEIVSAAEYVRNHLSDEPALVCFPR